MFIPKDSNNLCNLVLLNAHKYFTLLATLQLASVCCPRSFWIPSPSPRSMATVCLVQPQSHPPKKYYIRCIFAFHEAFLRSQVPQGQSHLLPLAGQLQCRSALFMRGGFVKASKGKSLAPSTTSTGPSSPIATTSPKMEIKKKRKRKSVKPTVTSETVSPPEKRKKIISESPDSQAEGPFCDSDTVSAPEDSSHTL